MLITTNEYDYVRREDYRAVVDTVLISAVLIVAMNTGELLPITVLVTARE